MTKTLIAALAALTLTAEANALAANEPLRPKAIMIMVDGLRADAVENALGFLREKDLRIEVIGYVR